MIECCTALQGVFFYPPAGWRCGVSPENAYERPKTKKTRTSSATIRFRPIKPGFLEWAGFEGVYFGVRNQVRVSSRSSNQCSGRTSLPCDRISGLFHHPSVAEALGGRLTYSGRAPAVDLPRSPVGVGARSVGSGGPRDRRPSPDPLTPTVALAPAGRRFLAGGGASYGPPATFKMGRIECRPCFSRGVESRTAGPNALKHPRTMAGAVDGMQPAWAVPTDLAPVLGLSRAGRLGRPGHEKPLGVDRGTVTRGEGLLRRHQFVYAPEEPRPAGDPASITSTVRATPRKVPTNRTSTVMSDGSTRAVTLRGSSWRYSRRSSFSTVDRNQGISCCLGLWFSGLLQGGRK